MDPLSTGTDTFGGYQSPEEADVVLFSRPLHFMPTNPFATLRNFGSSFLKICIEKVRILTPDSFLQRTLPIIQVVEMRMKVSKLETFRRKIGIHFPHFQIRKRVKSNLRSDSKRLVLEPFMGLPPFPTMAPYLATIPMKIGSIAEKFRIT